MRDCEGSMGAAAMGSGTRTVGGGRCVHSVRIWSCKERWQGGQHGGGSHGERHTVCGVEICTIRICRARRGCNEGSRGAAAARVSTTYK